MKSRGGGLGGVEEMRIQCKLENNWMEKIEMKSAEGGGGY